MSGGDGLGELKAQLRAELRAELEQLHHRVGQLEDQQAVRALQFKYGYYMDRCLFGDIVELFADDATLYFLNVYPGNARGPDELRPAPAVWPETFVMPFHYGHPVTGAR